MTRVAAVAVWSLLGVGCTADLFIAPGETDTEPGTTTSGEATSDATTAVSASGTGTSTTSPGTTTSSGTSTSDITTTSDASTTEATTTDGTGSSGEMGSSSTGEPPICGLVDLYAACQEREDCVWLGDPETGECDTSPCVTPAAVECSELGELDCMEALDCIYAESMCFLDVCAPCSFQDAEVCTASPFCDYNDGEMVCVPL